MASLSWPSSPFLVPIVGSFLRCPLVRIPTAWASARPPARAPSSPHRPAFILLPPPVRDARRPPPRRGHRDSPCGGLRTPLPPPPQVPFPICQPGEMLGSSSHPHLTNHHPSRWTCCLQKSSFLPDLTLSQPGRGSNGDCVLVSKTRQEKLHSAS